MNNTLKQQVREALEEIAASWDGCETDAPGGMLDVGAQLRKQFSAITYLNANGEGESTLEREWNQLMDALGCEDTKSALKKISALSHPAGVQEELAHGNKWTAFTYKNFTYQLPADWTFARVVQHLSEIILEDDVAGMAKGIQTLIWQSEPVAAPASTAQAPVVVDEREAGYVMMSAHASCPTEMSHPERMRWMADYFLKNYNSATSATAQQYVVEPVAIVTGSTVQWLPGAGKLRDRQELYAAPQPPHQQDQQFAKDCNVETFSQSDVDGYVRFLTWAVWRDHYRETSPDFVLFSETLGVLTQLGNMLTGWKGRDQSQAVDELVTVPLESYPPADQAFYRFWYGHMLNDLMQPPLCGIDHSTARYIWDAARASQEKA